MALRNQADVHNLVGLFADRPDALGVKEGTVYFATDTLAAYICVIGQPLKPARVWEPIGGAGGGGGGLLKFAGGIADTTIGGQVYLGDVVTEVGRAIELFYPIGLNYKAVQLSVHLGVPALPTTSGETVVALVKQPFDVVLAQLTYLATVGGYQTIAFSAPLVPGDLVDVRVVSAANAPAGPGSLFVTATVQLVAV